MAFTCVLPPPLSLCSTPPPGKSISPVRLDHMARPAEMLVLSTDWKDPPMYNIDISASHASVLTLQLQYR